MSHAHDVILIEVGDIDAGIVVREHVGFRFHAAERIFSTMDGRSFATVAAARQAAAELSKAFTAPRRRIA